VNAFAAYKFGRVNFADQKEARLTVALCLGTYIYRFCLSVLFEVQQPTVAKKTVCNA